MTPHDALRAVLETYVSAYRAGDAAGCAAVFSETAHLLSPYAPPTTGRVAIETLHNEWVLEGENKTMAMLDHGVFGDMAWMLARYDEGAGSEDAGTASLVLERQNGGAWLIALCSLNALKD